MAEFQAAATSADPQISLAVHVQLDTAEKLFCRCPVGPYRDDYDAEILRHMRPTHSESGAFDASAVQATARTNIFYRIHHTSVCTYEFDDNPPFPINRQALAAVAVLAEQCGSVRVDELHVMRTERLDGSFPGGFQRGAVVGVRGGVSAAGERFGLRHVALVEDSCRPCATIGADRVYFTDRSGVPLAKFLFEPSSDIDTAAARASRAIEAVRSMVGQRARGSSDAVRCDLSFDSGGGGVARRDISDFSTLERCVADDIQLLRRLNSRTLEGGLPGGAQAGRSGWLELLPQRVYAETDLPPISLSGAMSASSVRAQR